MRWKGRKQSDNVEDRRGQRPGPGVSGAAPAIMRLLPVLLRTKIGRLVLVLGIVAIFGGQMLGIDVLSLFLGGTGTTAVTAPGEPDRELTAADREMAAFVGVVLADTEQLWHREFRAMGRRYEEPKLILFSDRVNSACGLATSAVGPFYCPGDRQVYIDLSFFGDLARRHGAPGDFAQAYVIAHEVGHHVQTLLGISERVREAGRGRSEAEVNALSVRQELQADCFAGLWGHAANVEMNVLEAGDLEEALRAASAIGDDRLQREAGRQVVPDSFTHGTSEQRVKWFRAGFDSGDFAACDTFATREPG